MTQTVIALLLICCSSFAWAQVTETPVESGNGFVRRCASTEKDSTAMTDVERGYAAACLFYLNGFVTGVNSGTGLQRKRLNREYRRLFAFPKALKQVSSPRSF
jgi:hypothetical protein